MLVTASKIAIRDSKEYYDLQYLLALVLNKSERYSDSENIFKNILAFYPNEPYYLASFGILQENMMKYASALAYLWKSVVFLPERHDILYNIGQIYEKAESINEAFFLYTRITELFPWHQQAKIRLRECQSGDRSVVSPLDLLTIDISEFPFHRHLEKVQIEELPTEIATPSPVYPGFPENNNLAQSIFQSSPLILPQKRASSSEVSSPVKKC